MPNDAGNSHPAIDAGCFFETMRGSVQDGVTATVDAHRGMEEWYLVSLIH